MGQLFFCDGLTGNCHICLGEGNHFFYSNLNVAHQSSALIRGALSGSPIHLHHQLVKLYITLCATRKGVSGMASLLIHLNTNISSVVKFPSHSGNLMIPWNGNQVPSPIAL